MTQIFKITAVAFAFAATGAQAQVSCNSFGTMTTCSNGLTAQRFGNQTIYNNGVSSQQFGNQTICPAPLKLSHYYGSKGEVWDGSKAAFG